MLEQLRIWIKIYMQTIIMTLSLFMAAHSLASPNNSLELIEQAATSDKEEALALIKKNCHRAAFCYICPHLPTPQKEKSAWNFLLYQFIKKDLPRYTFYLLRNQPENNLVSDQDVFLAALLKGASRTVSRLLTEKEKGTFDIFLTSPNTSALHIAAQQGDPTLLEILLKHGVDPLFLDKNQTWAIEHLPKFTSKTLLHIKKLPEQLPYATGILLGATQQAVPDFEVYKLEKQNLTVYPNTPNKSYTYFIPQTILPVVQTSLQIGKSFIYNQPKKEYAYVIPGEE